jgi:hypothetical protein
MKKQQRAEGCVDLQDPLMQQLEGLTLEQRLQIIQWDLDAERAAAGKENPAPPADPRPAEADPMRPAIDAVERWLSERSAQPSPAEAPDSAQPSTQPAEDL